MRRTPFVVLAAAMISTATPAFSGPPRIRLVEFRAPLTSASAERILRSIDDADASGDALVLIELDTPGGLLDETQRTVQKILAARTPVVVWVGPAGARAGSAGFFLLLAADVATMAPGTRAGASSAIDAMRGGTKDDVLLEKVNQDSAALLRSLAEHRGRDVAAAEAAVLATRSYSDADAQRLGLIDLVAGSKEELIDALNGREVHRFDGTPITLATHGAEIVRSHFGRAHRFREFLASPEIAALLLIIGLGGLYLEFTHPGLILPGATGVVCLVLFAATARILPVSLTGVLLVVLALVLFALELKFTSHGLLTAAGFVSLLVGGRFLIDGPIPELRVGLGLFLPAAIVLTAFCVLAVRLVARAAGSPVRTGAAGLTGETGTVTQDLGLEGKVFVHGEIWDAVADRPLTRGTRVRVVRVDDLRLRVEPIPVRAQES